MRHCSICITFQEPTVTSIIDVKKTAAWGESGFPSEFLVAAKAGLTGETGSGPSAGTALAAGMVNSAANCGAAWLGQIWALILLTAALLPKSLFPTRGFRPDF